MEEKKKELKALVKMIYRFPYLIALVVVMKLVSCIMAYNLSVLVFKDRRTLTRFIMFRVFWVGSMEWLLV